MKKETKGLSPLLILAQTSLIPFSPKDVPVKNIKINAATKGVYLNNALSKPISKLLPKK
jgi:hypothetical protein